MLQRLCCFIVVFLLIFCGKNFAQGKSVVPVSAFSLRPNTIIKNDKVKANSISPGFYSAKLGFFCKKELQLDKITIMPIRFRLGSLEHVNYLEQKPNAVKPQ